MFSRPLEVTNPRAECQSARLAGGRPLEAVTVVPELSGGAVDIYRMVRS